MGWNESRLSRENKERAKTETKTKSRDEKENESLHWVYFFFSFLFPPLFFFFFCESEGSTILFLHEFKTVRENSIHHFCFDFPELR